MCLNDNFIAVSELTVEKDDSLWSGSSGVFLQQPAGDQSMVEKDWWVSMWILDGTALQQNNNGLK